MRVDDVTLPKYYKLLKNCLTFIKGKKLISRQFKFTAGEIFIQYPYFKALLLSPNQTDEKLETARKLMIWYVEVTIKLV